MRERAAPVEGAGDRPCDIDPKRFAVDQTHGFLSTNDTFELIAADPGVPIVTRAPRITPAASMLRHALNGSLKWQTSQSYKNE